jgi:hypothetical protein
MKQCQKNKILKWIFDNHEHHYLCEAYNLIEQKEIPILSKCEHGDKPYVDSLALEEFIESFETEGVI